MAVAKQAGQQLLNLARQVDALFRLQRKNARYKSGIVRGNHYTRSAPSALSDYISGWNGVKPSSDKA
jgi:hypothetical protein